MIGLLDLTGQALVSAALEREGPQTARMSGIDDVTRELGAGGLTALIIETDTLDARTLDLLAAANHQGVATLVVARDRSVATAVETLRAGASDYLAAPFEYGSLLRAVERLISESRAEASTLAGDESFVTQDPDLEATLELLRSVASSDATVLIEGESGTGKELLAQLVHRASPRRDRELISINCAALPLGLLESELFGHERGAFTGALSRVIGKFELADRSTILLDEIGELDLGLQAKLLRVVQERQVQRIGARRPIHVDFRLVTTTNRNLAAEVEAHRFREDLFYRLNVLPVKIKPLRERQDDVPLLIERFIRRHLAAGRAVPEIPEATLSALKQYHWPGNVRELENLIERLVLTRGRSRIEPVDLSFLDRSSVPSQRSSSGPPAFKTIREMERWLIVRTLSERMGNRTQTARALEISIRTLRNKINEYEIIEPETLPQTGVSTANALRRGYGHPAKHDRAEAAG